MHSFILRKTLSHCKNYLNYNVDSGIYIYLAKVYSKKINRVDPVTVRIFFISAFVNKCQLYIRYEHSIDINAVYCQISVSE